MSQLRDDGLDPGAGEEMGTERQGREEREQEGKGGKEKRGSSELGGNNQQPEAEVGNGGDKQQPEAEVGNGGDKGKKWKMEGASVDTKSVSMEGTMGNTALDALLPQQRERVIHGLRRTQQTETQKRMIPQLLNTGRDVFVATWTDSEYMVSYLARAVEVLDRGRFQQEDGTGVIVICPTRELAEHINGVATEYFKLHIHSYTHGIVMEGSNCRREARKLRKGVNLLVATPGCLLDHILNTEGFFYENLRYLVIDEADRILETGSEEDMKKIVEILDDRQTALFCATLTNGVEELARVSLKRDPVYIGVDAGLKHNYCVVSSSLRFHYLLTLLKQNLKKKVMVFCSSSFAVSYHSRLLNYRNIPCLGIHDKQKQEEITTTYLEFCNAEEGILICTDVAVRGLDFPAVDLIIQYDPPNDPEEYLHKVGRTPSREGARGTAMLCLRTEELKFFKYFKGKGPFEEHTVKKPDTGKLRKFQKELGKLVEKHNELHRLAQAAYISYLLAYKSHARKDIFNFRDLILAEVGFSFGLTSPLRGKLRLPDKFRKNE